MSLVLKQSESGDWFLVPYLKADTFRKDELEGKADYADYVELHRLRIIDYEIE